MQFHNTDLSALAKERRVALVNSLPGFRTACLVATVSEAGQTNLAMMNSAMHIGASPPLLGLLFRPDSVPRHSLENIRARGHYTLNHVPHGLLEAAHQTSARYPRDRSEFAATGLSEGWWESFPAPFVLEARVRIGLELREELTIASNGTHLVVGEIVFLEVPDNALDATGALDPAAVDSVACVGLGSYYRARHEKTLPYAKVPPSDA